MEELPPSPSTVIAAYAQPFVDGRKVVVFGDCTSGLAEHLVERGARLVHVYDSDLTRVAEAAARGSSSNIAYAPLGQSGVAVRDGAFDVGVIENLSNSDDAAVLMKRLRRALAARGVALVISPNMDTQPLLLAPREARREGPSYYELYEIVSREFDEIRMVGQTPFVGYALADFTPGAADEYSIDTGFLPGGSEEPEWYVAVASHFPVVIDPYSVVQLPASLTLAAIAGASADASAGASSAALDEAERRVAQLEKRLAKTESVQVVAPERELLIRAKAELEKRDAWVTEVEARAAAADERADAAEDRADAADKHVAISKSRIAEATARIVELEAKLKATDQREREAQSRLKEAEKQQREAQLRLAAAADELRAAHDAPVRAPGADQEQKALTRKLEQLERELAKQRQTVETQERSLEGVHDERAAFERDIQRAEDQLRERAAAVAELRRDVSRMEQLAAQLLAELEELREAPVQAEPGVADTDRTQAVSPSGSEADSARLAELEANLDELAQVDARRVADLTAMQWTVQELEGKLADQEAHSRAELEQLRAELQEKLALLQQVQNSPLR